MPIIRDFTDPFLQRLDSQLVARTTDLERIAEFLASPAGVNFAAKQALLRDVNSPTLAARLASILAQVPLSGTGIHFSPIDFDPLKTYAGNAIAATEAKVAGTITVRKTRRMRGQQTWKNRGFSEVGTSDTVGTTGILGNESDEAKAAIKSDTLPIVFSIVGEPNSTIVFRGFIQGLSDSFSANWNAFNYVGRGETLYNYTNGTRGIGYTMMVPMFSEAEQEPTYRKLNSLLSYAYPKYVDNLPQGTVAKMKLGDYITCYGTITSMVASVTEDVPWSTPDGENRILPQVISLQVSLNVIHERLPERYIEGDPFYVGNKALLPKGVVEAENVIERGIV